MGKNKPKSGSKQFWPRKRSKRMYARVRSWFDSKEINLLGFAGYKAGMTHAFVNDTRSNSLTKGQKITFPVTVIECPPLRVLSVRFYSTSVYGSKVLGEVLASNLEKVLKRKVSLPKKYDSAVKLTEWEKKLENVSYITLKVYTQPKKTGIGKKKPEVFEIALGGNDVKAQFEFAKTIMEKEIRLSDVMKEGNKVDVHGITVGKGFQGVVKRFGVGLRGHKSEKKRRACILGSRTPGYVPAGTKMAGQVGSHLRTEYNKDVLSISSDISKVNPKGGFLHYGFVKNDYILIKGSVPGSQKRLIRFSVPVRGVKGLGSALQFVNVSLESKQ